jgi:hypothetical protein
MKASDPFANCLITSYELESFFHDFIRQVAKRRPKPGADVTKYAKELRLKMPAVLKGAKITWAGPIRVDAADDEAG